jgi:hypothetical protein
MARGSPPRAEPAPVVGAVNCAHRRPPAGGLAAVLGQACAATDGIQRLVSPRFCSAVNVSGRSSAAYGQKVRRTQNGPLCVQSTCDSGRSKRAINGYWRSVTLRRMAWSGWWAGVGSNRRPSAFRSSYADSTWRRITLYRSRFSTTSNWYASNSDLGPRQLSLSTFS